MIMTVMQQKPSEKIVVRQLMRFHTRTSTNSLQVTTWIRREKETLECHQLSSLRPVEFATPRPRRGMQQQRMPWKRALERQVQNTLKLKYVRLCPASKKIGFLRVNSRPTSISNIKVNMQGQLVHRALQSMGSQSGKNICPEKPF